MKKIILMLSLLAIGMFLIGCAEEISDKKVNDNLPEDKLAGCIEMEAQLEPNPLKTIECFTNAGIPKEEVCGYFKTHYNLFLFCYNDYFKIEPTYSSELCAGYPDDTNQSSAQRFCFAHLGVQEEDITLCPEPTEVFAYHHSCYTGIAEAKKDESICGYINKGKMDYGGKMNCYLRVAIAKDDPAVCLNIVGTDLKYECIADVSGGDLEVCVELFGEKISEVCIKEVKKHIN